MVFPEFVERTTFAVLLEIRTGFKLDEFKKFDNQFQKSNYAHDHLKYLGSGSAREVFLLSNRFVLKLALPENLKKGIAQNEAEVNVYTDPRTKPVVTTIYDFADDYSWIIAELARPLRNEDEFRSLSGMRFGDFILLLRRFEAADFSYESLLQDMTETYEEEKSERTKHVLERRLNLLKTNKTLKAAMILMDEMDLLPGDITRIDHWGKTADGKLVLLDYGYTEDVWLRYYD